MDPADTAEQPAAPMEVAREFLREVLAAMHMAADVEVEETEDGTWRLEVVGDDAGLLIGRYGDTINSLQYLTTLVTQRRTGEHVRLLLDAEGYRDRRHAALVEQARDLAAEVKRAGQEAELDPLSPFERRIIHNALMDHPDVVTYSEGEEPERRVIIAPRPRRA
jgi:spoIIIJ-associated protein